MVLAAHALETPRLLLSGAADRATGSPSDGLVGRRFMSHPTWQEVRPFDEPIRR